MNCYRTNCKEKCNDIKKMYCLYKLNKEQQKVIARIRKNNKNYCRHCGGKLIQSKYMGQVTRLCTGCGLVTKGDKIIRKCLINSRKVS
ncbi:hypothetical protein [Paratissierella segnis]|uniref:Uncharacterized protein n=1 Tax=Paratissierella segnis TaxID=2763679 RepID=A0A926EUV7_9FIRM|nr:hypothetical protein [Paratissierella segnis]MBC8588066.1 hypothetical protein [Paratissierella segnis]